ncbi:hypothetical protein [Pelomonas sp. KK5]|uniref:hypothetical protein n=1 Tax=Pelomonas sp. KK5 TaxID=1855730 RepID=UPI00097C778F|nr:hypothetical protein [Pelomonas sp. KK5]
MTSRLTLLQHRFAFPIVAGSGVLASACFARFLVWHLGWRFGSASASGGQTFNASDSVLAYTLLGCILLPTAGVVATLMLNTVSAVSVHFDDGARTENLESRQDV